MSKRSIMKIGIVVHSQTGHTLSVAEKLQEKLTAAGHSANIEKISPVDAKQTDPKKIKIEKLPDLSPYDAFVFAAPVQAFSLSPVMKIYLPQLPSLNGKKVACFVTKGLRIQMDGWKSCDIPVEKWHRVQRRKSCRNRDHRMVRRRQGKSDHCDGRKIQQIVLI